MEKSAVKIAAAGSVHVLQEILHGQRGFIVKEFNFDDAGLKADRVRIDIKVGGKPDFGMKAGCIPVHAA